MGADPTKASIDLSRREFENDRLRYAREEADGRAANVNADPTRPGDLPAAGPVEAPAHQAG